MRPAQSLLRLRELPLPSCTLKICLFCTGTVEGQPGSTAAWTRPCWEGLLLHRGLLPSFKGFAEIPFWKQIPTNQGDCWLGFWMLHCIGCVWGDRTALCPDGQHWSRPAPLPSGSPGKAEDLCPCLKWVVAHQRQGVLLRDESWDASALFWEAPSLSFGQSCKSAGQVSSQGQSHPCISIQGSGSRCVGKASGSTCCKVGGVESCVHEPGVMSGSLQKLVWAPEDGGLCSSWGEPQLLLLLGTAWARVEQLDFFIDESR